MTTAAFKTAEEFVEACVNATRSPKVERCVRLEQRLEVLFARMDSAATAEEFAAARAEYERLNREYWTLTDEIQNA